MARRLTHEQFNTIGTILAALIAGVSLFWQVYDKFIENKIEVGVQ